MFFSGGDEAEPVFGRLGSAELTAKPTARSVFALLRIFIERVISRVIESPYIKELNSPLPLFIDYGEWE